MSSAGAGPVVWRRGHEREFMLPGCPNCCGVLTHKRFPRKQHDPRKFQDVQVNKVFLLRENPPVQEAGKALDVNDPDQKTTLLDCSGNKQACMCTVMYVNMQTNTHARTHTLGHTYIHKHTHTHTNLNNRAVCKQIDNIMGLFSVQTISC